MLLTSSLSMPATDISAHFELLIGWKTRAYHSCSVNNSIVLVRHDSRVVCLLLASLDLCS